MKFTTLTKIHFEQWLMKQGPRRKFSRTYYGNPLAVWLQDVFSTQYVSVKECHANVGTVCSPMPAWAFKFMERLVKREAVSTIDCLEAL